MSSIKALGADAMQSIGTEVLKQGDEPEVEADQEVVAEDEVATEEQVAEEAPAVDIEEDLAALLVAKNFPKSSKLKHAQSLKQLLPLR